MTTPSWSTFRAALLLSVAGFLALGNAPAASAAKPLRVAATTPDLGDLVRRVGGEAVRVFVFAKGTENAHYIDAKPSFVKELSRADLYVQMGMELEIGWAPVLLQKARNARVLPGAPGYLDTSTAIAPMEQPVGIFDRSMGDVHPLGNPHYLVDPLNGLRVARLIRDRLIELRPDEGELFGQHYQAFEHELVEALVGADLERGHRAEELLDAIAADELGRFLARHGEEARLAGWLGALRPYPGTEVVADHNQWPYFAKRFGLRVVGYLEPKPGLSPTTSHLSALIKRMRAKRISAVLASIYFDPRALAFVAEKIGAAVVPMAHAVGARPGTDSYLAMIDHNVRSLVEALSRNP